MVKLVSRKIPANAIVWVPGDQLPDQVHKLIAEKVESWAVEYDQIANERLKNWRQPAPIELGKIVEGMFYQLSNVSFQHGIEAVALFIQELKANADRRVKNGEGALDMATKDFDSAYQTRIKLDKILAGTLQITVPEVRYGFQDGAKNIPDPHPKMQNVDNGEAITGKRPAHKPR